jgi:tetraacyldisaccharide 4'-kinase
MLVEDGVDIIVTDDGLQHLRLARDFEICIVDAARGLGNGWLLPAGPLRESPQRLATVDQVLVNGHVQGQDNAPQDALEFELRAHEACRLNGSLTRPLDGFADTTVHALAGIGNPARFFDLLRAHQIQVIEHAFADHAVLATNDLQFDDEFNVFMTEKDAVKLGTNLADKYWYIPVEVHMDSAQVAELFKHIDSRLRDCVRDAHD